MKTQRQSVGKWGEDLAEEYLQHVRGFEILGRNIRTQYGEIDILARDGDLILFVEVKTRTTSSFAFPEDNVHAIKRAHMNYAAQAYITEHPEYGDQWRIDVIAIQGCIGSSVEITYFENAVNS